MVFDSCQKFPSVGQAFVPAHAYQAGAARIAKALEPQVKAMNILLTHANSENSSWMIVMR